MRLLLARGQFDLRLREIIRVIKTIDVIATLVIACSIEKQYTQPKQSSYVAKYSFRPSAITSWRIKRGIYFVINKKLTETFE